MAVAPRRPLPTAVKRWLESFPGIPARILGNERLREPQRAAYLQVYDFLVKQRRPLPAVVRLPTGCGKSGIIACLPFGIANGRVLIVAPNLAIRDGITEVLTGSPSRPPFLLDRGVLAEYAQLPKVVVLAEHANREDCLRADVIVANVQQIQSWLDLFPAGFFDLVIVDEGHHTPASSWQKISQKFQAAKKVYLTATPFRADGQETEYTTGEILEMREELWFSRGVALSQTCNRSIVDKSLQILQKKRAFG